MKIGDRLKLTPTFDSKAGLEDAVNMTAIVVYIHPQMRFFVAEFAAPLGSWREAFPLVRTDGGAKR